MSNRDYLNRRIVPVFVLMLVCFGAFAVAGLAAVSAPWLPVVPFLGFAACILYLHYGVRCPRCRSSIAGLTMLPRGGYFRFSQKLQFCPFCGLSLEAEHDG